MTQKYLLDTHAWLWFLSGDSRLSEHACSAIQDGAAACYVSMASYWEVQIKISIGKLKLVEGWRKLFENDMANNHFSWLSIERKHIDQIDELPWHHRDPFDRLIIAQAQSENVIIISQDRHIGEYDVNVLW